MTVDLTKLQEINKNLDFYKESSLLIVTKNQSIDDISALIAMGYTNFGENRVQEAQLKFQPIINKHKISLHLIGSLQTNKVKSALSLFDTIQSIDRISLVDEIHKNFLNEKKLIRTKDFFIQVNIGNEKQKSGVNINNLSELYHYCREKQINILGLMCIPPNDTNTEAYFQEMNVLKQKINPSLKLSMGMSGDYMLALKKNSNLIRIGSLIFKQ